MGNVLQVVIKTTLFLHIESVVNLYIYMRLLALFMILGLVHWSLSKTPIKWTLLLQALGDISLVCVCVCVCGVCGCVCVCSVCRCVCVCGVCVGRGRTKKYKRWRRVQAALIAEAERPKEKWTSESCFCGACFSLARVAHETAICRSPHYQSDWHSRIATQLAIQTHLLSKCSVPKQNCLCLHFRQNICLRVGLLRIGQVFFCLL